jgi:hypothetical protein
MRSKCCQADSPKDIYTRRSRLRTFIPLLLISFFDIKEELIMSLWSKANEKLNQKGLRLTPMVKSKKVKERAGMREGSERIILRDGVCNGEIVKRQTIVPKSRSRYSPKPGESIGPAKPNRNHGQVEKVYKWQNK